VAAAATTVISTKRPFNRLRYDKETLNYELAKYISDSNCGKNNAVLDFDRLQRKDIVEKLKCS